MTIQTLGAFVSAGVSPTHSRFVNHVRRVAQVPLQFIDQHPHGLLWLPAVMLVVCRLIRGKA